MSPRGIKLTAGSFSGGGRGRTFCKDCGVEAWHQWDEAQNCYAHEDFYVHFELWDAVCPDDAVETWRDETGRIVGRNGRYVLCIGCLEARLGRQLAPDDFKPNQEPYGEYWAYLVGRPPTSRFCDRLGISLAEIKRGRA